MNTHHARGTEVLLGEAVDANPVRRPGVPMEATPPRPIGAAHWTEPARQHDPGFVLKRRGLAELTPVFGTACPPRGLSGLLRKAAYRIPDYRMSHWLVLLFADRVDVFEHRPLRLLRVALPAAAGAVGIALLRRRSRC